MHRPRKIVLFFSYFFATWVVILAFLAFPRMNGNPPSMFIEMVDGTAHRPYVYRALIPSIVRTVTEFTPPAIKSRVSSAAESKRPLSRLVYLSGVDQDSVYQFFVALALFFGCFFGLAWVLRGLITTVYDYPSFVADLAPLGGLLFLPAFFRYDNYIYDPATVFLFAAGLLALLRKKTVAYYILFVLACINKETALLLTGFMIVERWGKIPRWHLASHVAVQGLIWGGVKYWLILVYSQNPGQLVEFHLIDHNLTLFTYGFRSVYFIVFAGMWAWLIGTGWRNKPVDIKRFFSISFLPLFAAGMLFGYIDEVRIFYEVYAPAFLLAIATLVEQFGRSERSVASVSTPASGSRPRLS